MPNYVFGTREQNVVERAPQYENETYGTSGMTSGTGWASGVIDLDGFRSVFIKARATATTGSSLSGVDVMYSLDGTDWTVSSDAIYLTEFDSVNYSGNYQGSKLLVNVGARYIKLRYSPSASTIPSAFYVYFSRFT